ncbi:MAG: hypothetical protein NHB32_17790 [Fischerella sp. CENA71]|nr:hypothetical protein [Fischerella sp. CENA71]
MIAAATRDGRITIWNTNGDLLKILEGHSDIADNVSFSPDGKTLASASRDDSVILWNLNLDELEQSANLWKSDLNQVMQKSCYWAGHYVQYNLNAVKNDQRLQKMCDESNTIRQPS